MGQGLYIDYADGGPPMAITAGMRALMYVGDIPAGAWGGDVSYYLPGLVPSRQTVMIPVGNTYDLSPVSGVYPAMIWLTGFNISGNSIVQTFGRGNGGWPVRRFAATIWQVDDTVSETGLLIADSSDFTSINLDSTNLMTSCVFRGDVTISGEWQPPRPAGSKGLTVFASWDGGVLEFDGTTIYATSNANGWPAAITVNARVAVFAAGVAPTPGPGLTMFNAEGKCTFSSSSRPFVTQGESFPLKVGSVSVESGGNWPTSEDGKQIVGNKMAQLGIYGYHTYSVLGNRNGYFRRAGLQMAGGMLSLGRGRLIDHITYAGSNSDVWNAAGGSVLLIPGMY